MKSICPKDLGGSAQNLHVGHTHFASQKKKRDLCQVALFTQCVPSLLGRKVSCGWDVWLLSPGCAGSNPGPQFSGEARKSHRRSLQVPGKESHFCVLWKSGRSCGLSLMIKSAMETFGLLYSVGVLFWWTVACTWTEILHPLISQNSCLMGQLRPVAGSESKDERAVWESDHGI